MTETSSPTAAKTIAPATLKAKHLMRRSLRGDLTIDNPYGSKTAFETIKSPSNKPLDQTFTVTAN
jgi:hypothetical protein